MTRFKESAIFFALSLLVSAGVFRDAMWGAKLLAPLDILPAAFTHYKFMDPGTDGIPDNHHIIDQITYDLPLQHLIYESVRKGIIPWWDPYTYGGRPLLADAHINGTDPVRLLCDITMPFAVAYNWNLILKSLLTGLGMFLLLRYLGFSNAVSTVFAITYQFAGCFAVFFGHPWIQASFLYYPYLWIIWDRGMTKQFSFHAAAGSILTALVFYCGNLQSHVYLPLFAAAFFAGAVFSRSGHNVRTLLLIAVSGLLGALLAAPVLLNQIEFFLLSTRTVVDNAWLPREILKGPLSLTGVFPWALGTFRTIDLSKVFNASSLGFAVFIGTTGGVLAAIAAANLVRHFRQWKHAEWTSLLLIFGYLSAISTPVERILYTRSSALAVMGLVILAASGFRLALRCKVENSRRQGYWLIGMVSIGAVGLQAALSFYPFFEPEIRKAFMSRVEARNSSLVSPELRSFQVSNLPGEVGMGNPEVALAVLGVLTLGIALLQSAPSRRKKLLFSSVGISMFSVLFFYSQYIPSHPIDLWHRLQAGGHLQNDAIMAAETNHSRILESSTNFQSMVFPNALGALYRVHTVHGYSALQPRCISRCAADAPPIPSAWIADHFVDNVGAMKTKRFPTGPARFPWEVARSRHAAVLHEDFNTISISLSSGPPGRIFRTDTYYPGWSVVNKSGRSEPLQKVEPCFSMTTVEASSCPVDLVFHYRPRFFIPGLMLAATSLLVVAILLLWPRRFCAGKQTCELPAYFDR